MTHWNIYYRGSLSSCNYGCDYCPFAKTKNTREELLQDQRELEQFVGWVAKQKKRAISILFTPWGEALIHRGYRQALVQLSRLKQVKKVCIQTNLSGPVDELTDACRESLALWATYHPQETSLERFLSKCKTLDKLRLRYSVGIVGLKEHLDDMELLRSKLSDKVYLWVNAYKRVKDYYNQDELNRIRAVDPHFQINNQIYPSFGRTCAAGETHFTVDGLGDVRRCHFIKDTLGNIYSDELDDLLKPRLCSEDSCRCYIGYIHLKELNLGLLYGSDILARIPQDSFSFRHNLSCSRNSIPIV